MNEDSIQKVQEDEYDFPYHYVPTYKQVFNQCFNWGWGINYIATIEFIIDKLKQEQFELLVDVGCGDGRLTKELREEFKEKKIEGVDYSEKAIRLAKAMDFAGTYHCVDIMNDGLNTRYDIALLIEVFEHIPPQIGDDFLSAVARLIRKDGVLLMTVPHVNAPLETKHYRHFSVKNISKCLEKYFEIIEVIPFEKKDKRKDMIDNLLTNDFFILNHVKLKNFLYRMYKEHLFITEEKFCKRIYIKAKVK